LWEEVAPKGSEVGFLRTLSSCPKLRIAPMAECDPTSVGFADTSSHKGRRT
jgi:hypothetical protein